MPQPQTFLRFTTRGLLYVMLGLSVALWLGLLFLPQLLGVPRVAIAVGLGGSFGMWAIYLSFLHVGNYLKAKQTGECLFRYPTSLLPTWVVVGGLLFLGSGIILVWAFRELAAGGSEVIFLIHSATSGFLGAAGCKFLLQGRSMASLQMHEHGVVTHADGFVPWTAVRVGPRPAGSSNHSLEQWLRSKRHVLDLTLRNWRRSKPFSPNTSPATPSSATSNQPR